MTVFANSNFKKAIALIGFLASSVDAVVTVKQDPVNLRTAGDFAILSKSGVSTTNFTSVTGDIGVSPIAGLAIEGFNLTKDSSTQFATSSLDGVTGKVWAADYTPPTPSKMTTAISDMATAFVDAAGRSIPDFIELGKGNIGGNILEPGLYKWSSGVLFTSSLTFNGTSTGDDDNANDDVWILQIAGDLDVGSNANITLIGGAKAENIFWQISGSTTFGTTSHVEGIFLCATQIDFKTGSSMNGAALSQTAVTLDDAIIVKTSTGPV